jgi:lipopolysaccharide/colanic/teichoic acid biosynthesis glycosyltransferase
MTRRSKRIMDLLLASTALVVLAPLMAVVALAVRRDVGSPILFRQERPGRHGKPFTMLKFRTMREPEAGTTASVEDPDRVQDRERTSRLGHLLRSTSLDELPELWNVIRGEMSIVGPRPLMMEYLPRYSPEQARRHEVRPGITGLAQIKGRHALDWDERFRLDVWYIDNWSLALDARIIGDTFLEVLRRSGQPELEEADVIFYGAEAGSTAAVDETGRPVS